MNKAAPFKKFLETFETEEMRDYCEDMIKLENDRLFSTPSSTSLKYHNATQCKPGGHMYHVLMACEVMNYILGLDYIKEKYPKPKQRDCFRIAICLHDGVKLGWGDSKYTLHEHPQLAAEWIENTKVEHDIDPRLKKYCARLVASHSGQWTSSPRSSVVLPKPENDERFLIHLCDYISSRSNLDMIYDEETIKAVEANL